MALTNNGKVFSWGDGEDGKLGHGSRADHLTPRKIEVRLFAHKPLSFFEYFSVNKFIQTSMLADQVV